MRHLILTTLILIFCYVHTFAQATQDEYWEDLTTQEQQRLLQHRETTDGMRALVGGENFDKIGFQETFKVLDAINLSSPELRPLHLHTFNILILQSDGYLSEGIGKYAAVMIENEPVYALSNILSAKKLHNNYVYYIGYEFYSRGGTEGETELKRWKTSVLERSKAALSAEKKEQVVAFLKGVGEEVERLKQEHGE